MAAAGAARTAKRCSLPVSVRGSVVTAFVVLHEGVEGDDATRKALQEHVKAAIAPYKYPRRIEFREALPRTETGKLQRFALRGAPTPATSPVP